MIKYFSALYAGHVLEGDGIGFDGTPADDRWYPNERFVRTFDISKEIAQLMDELGCDILWSAEHHFQREGYECVPNLLMWGLWLAQHTKRLKFGCAFNILTMWHPLRLAEDFAMAESTSSSATLSERAPRNFRHNSDALPGRSCPPFASRLFRHEGEGSTMHRSISWR